MSEHRRGLFVAFEGIDGSGKSATARHLLARLRAAGVAAAPVEHNGHDLGHSAVSDYAAELVELKRRTHRFAFEVLGDLHWALIRASYYALVDRFVVTPALTRGEVAVADGWYHKFLARVVASGATSDPELLARIFGTIRAPDVVLILDTAPELAAVRKQDFNAAEYGVGHVQGDHRAAFATYQHQVRRHLLRMAEDRAWHRITSAGEPPEEIAARAMEVLTGTGRLPRPALSAAPMEGAR